MTVATTIATQLYVNIGPLFPYASPIVGERLAAVVRCGRGPNSPPKPLTALASRRERNRAPHTHRYSY
jgi:hypothetical protein